MAIWWATFDNYGEVIAVEAGGGRSSKRPALRRAVLVAKQKARAKAARRGVRTRLTSIRCVG